MTTHAIHYEDNQGDLMEVDYQCSSTCCTNTLQAKGIERTAPAAQHAGVSYGAWPCGSETDYNVYCSGCGALLWEGLDARWDAFAAGVTA